MCSFSDTCPFLVARSLVYSDDISFICLFIHWEILLFWKMYWKIMNLGVSLLRWIPVPGSLTFRTREDAVYVTVPPGTTMKEVKSAIEQLRPRLRIARKKRTRPLIDLNFRIDTEFFKLNLVSGQRERFLSRSELGEMQIICPPEPISRMKDYRHGCVKSLKKPCGVMRRLFFHPVCICFRKSITCLIKVWRSIPAVDVGAAARRGVT